MRVLSLMLAFGLNSGVALAGGVVVLQSDTLAPYAAAVEAFEVALGQDVRVYNLRGDRERAVAVAHQLQRSRPDLVFAVGAKAAWTASNLLSEVPQVFAQVKDPERVGIGGMQVTGVVSMIPTETMLSQFRVFLPDVQRLGFLHSAQMPVDQQSLVDEAKSAGFELLPVEIQSAKDLRSAVISTLRKVDALWLPPDPHLVNSDSFRFLSEASRRSGIPILTSSEALVHAGALIGVVPDHAASGAQAAALAKRILIQGAIPDSISYEAPLGFRVLLNEVSLAALDITIDPLFLDLTEPIRAESSDR